MASCDLMSVSSDGAGMGAARAFLWRRGAAVSCQQPILIAARGWAPCPGKGNLAPTVGARSWGKSVMFAWPHCKWVSK